MDMRNWFDTRSYRHQDFEDVRPPAGQTTTLILPTRNVAASWYVFALMNFTTPFWQTEITKESDASYASPVGS